VTTGHPLTTRGLYPVVTNVAANQVSGYGEVFVPLFIMDYAVRYVIRPTGTLATVDEDISALTTATPAGTSTLQSWFAFAPVYKRVNFVVKTDGYATMTGVSGGTTGTSQTATDAAPGAQTTSWDYVFPFVGPTTQGKLNNVVSGNAANPLYTQAQTKTYWLSVGQGTAFVSVGIDQYVEAGEYNTYFVTAPFAVTGITTPYAYQRGAIARHWMRVDRTVDTISTGIASGKGVLTLIPFAGQDWSGATASVQLQSTNTVAQTLAMSTVGKDRSRDLLLAQTATLTQVYGAQTAGAIASPATAEVPLSAGTYTYTFTAATGATCANKIPSTGTTIPIVDQQATDLFVLNTYGCTNNNNDAQRLSLVIVQRQSASATGNSPLPAANSRAVEDDKRHAVPLAL
jgi:hypothetical protein